MDYTTTNVDLGNLWATHNGAEYGIGINPTPLEYITTYGTTSWRTTPGSATVDFRIDHDDDVDALRFTLDNNGYGYDQPDVYPCRDEEDINPDDINSEELDKFLGEFNIK